MSSLSILIPTLPDRYPYLRRLQAVLQPQVDKFKDRVNIHYNDTGRAMTIGEKRNAMIAMASGEYFSFIDDDDLVPAFYVSEMLKAIDQKPDVVTFKGFMTTNGAHRVDFVIKLGERYEERGGKYYRWPNHLCAFKKSVVGHVQFQRLHQREDYLWSERIKNKGLLKSEVHIDREMYQYLFRTHK